MGCSTCGIRCGSLGDPSVDRNWFSEQFIAATFNSLISAFPLAFEAIIVDIDNEVHGVKAMPPGIPVPPDGIIKTQLMEVFVRRENAWWIEAYHNVDVKPPARSPQQVDHP